MDKDSISSTPSTQHPSPKGFYQEAFRAFFKTGAFILGGGHAMISIIQDKVVVKRERISKDRFADLIAVAQSCPGILAANISVFVGYKIRKTLGAFVACLGTILPSSLTILCIILFLHQFMDIPQVTTTFRGIRPAVVALIAASTFTLVESAKPPLVSCWIPIITAIAIRLLGANPVYIIIAAGLDEPFYGKFTKSAEWNASPSPSEGRESLTRYNFTKEMTSISSERRRRQMGQFWINNTLKTDQ